MKKILLALAGIGLVIGGTAYVQASEPDCVTLYVDYGPLNNEATTISCIPVDGKTNALDILATAKLETQGTQRYGNATLCRLDGLPDASTEPCLDMPPADAYWGVLVKEYELIPNPFDLIGEWGWAQTGIDEVYLNPGDSLGLVFADNGEVKYP